MCTHTHAYADGSVPCLACHKHMHLLRFLDPCGVAKPTSAQESTLCRQRNKSCAHAFGSLKHTDTLTHTHTHTNRNESKQPETKRSKHRTFACAHTHTCVCRRFSSLPSLPQTYAPPAHCSVHKQMCWNECRTAPLWDSLHVSIGTID